MIATLSDIERKIISQLQEGIPIVEKPFEKLSSEIGISQSEYLDIVRNLKEQKIIRQISPIYDTKSLGYDSSLVAFKVEDDIEKVAQFVNSHPGVSHNYERTHEFNLWFTIAVPPDSSLGLERTVQLIAEKNNIKQYAILRTEKLYKIGVKLDTEGTKKKEKIKKTRTKINYQLQEEDKEIIKISQEDIPLVENPFEEYVRQLGISQDYLLGKLNLYLKAGLMRRFAAILYHRKVGFKANGMTVWNVPQEKIDELGYKLASYKAVTHCYKRTTNEHWRYPLFSMIHSQTKEELEEFVKDIAQEEGIQDYLILYSTTEFKKKRIKYFSDEFYNWESKYSD